MRLWEQCTHLGSLQRDQCSGVCHGCGKTLTLFDKCLSKHSCVLVNENVWRALYSKGTLNPLKENSCQIQGKVCYSLNKLRDETQIFGGMAAKTAKIKV